jgi:hypothetical protein
LSAIQSYGIVLIEFIELSEIPVDLHGKGILWQALHAKPGTMVGVAPLLSLFLYANSLNIETVQ